MYLYPQVKHYEKREGYYEVNDQLLYILHNEISQNLIYNGRGYFRQASASYEENVIMDIDPSFGEEAYSIEIKEDGITIKHATEKGAFYGLITLFQINLNRTKQGIPCLYIEDEPELQVRGYMLDIARNKVPKLETLMGIIDLLAHLKFNHFELYVEGLAYYYPSFKDLYHTGMTPLRPSEFKKLEAYAKQNMIDLVPCHNGLGHMTEWLTHYPELAIMPDGMFMWGSHRPASTVNPLDPKSLELVQGFYKDAMKSSTSRYFHMNLDEPYELGHGKTKEEAQKIGVGQMYLDYVLKLAAWMKKHQRIPLIWGDVLNHYPETLEKLPKDIIFVDWGYDKDYPFEKTLKRLGDLGVSFMAAPGTSSWNSITGRTSSMIQNIKQACVHTKLNKGRGILLTDWGDFGHLQTNVISLPAIVYAGLESWRGNVSNENGIRRYIDHYVFNNKNRKSAGQVLLEMGSYVDMEERYMSNGTQIMTFLWQAQHFDQSNLAKSIREAFRDHPYGNNDFYYAIQPKFNVWRDITKRGIVSRDKNSLLYHDEIRVSIDLLDMIISIIRLQNPSCRGEEHNKLVKYVKQKYVYVLHRLMKNWRARNKKGKLIDSLDPLLIYFLYTEQLTYEHIVKQPIEEPYETVKH